VVWDVKSILLEKLYALNRTIAKLNAILKKFSGIRIDKV